MRSRSIVKTGRESSSALSSVLTIERLQMAQDDYHVPVLAREVVEQFAGLARRRRRRRHAGRRRARRRDPRRRPPAARPGRRPRPRGARRAARAACADEPRARVVAGSFGDLAAVLADAADVPRGRPGGGRPHGPGSLVAPARRGRARLLLPLRRPPRHAHGPDARRDGRSVPRTRRRARTGPRAARQRRGPLSPAPSPERSSPRAPPRPESWSRRSNRRYPPPRGGAATWPPAPSRRCASRSTTRRASSRAASPTRSTRWRWAACSP